MVTGDHIWALVSKRLANEATESELQELDLLLKEYSKTDDRIKIMADWWREGSTEEMTRPGRILFEKIKREINEVERLERTRSPYQSL